MSEPDDFAAACARIAEESPWVKAEAARLLAELVEAAAKENRTGPLPPATEFDTIQDAIAWLAADPENVIGIDPAAAGPGIIAAVAALVRAGIEPARLRWGFQ